MLCGDLFFDVNQDTAQEITKEALNKVTSLIVTGSKFGGILQSREFVLKERGNGCQAEAMRRRKRNKMQRKKKKQAMNVESLKLI